MLQVAVAGKVGITRYSSRAVRHVAVVRFSVVATGSKTIRRSSQERGSPLSKVSEHCVPLHQYGRSVNDPPDMSPQRGRNLAIQHSGGKRKPHGRG